MKTERRPIQISPRLLTTTLVRRIVHKKRYRLKQRVEIGFASSSAMAAPDIIATATALLASPRQQLHATLAAVIRKGDTLFAGGVQILTDRNAFRRFIQTIDRWFIRVLVVAGRVGIMTVPATTIGLALLLCRCDLACHNKVEALHPSSKRSKTHRSHFCRVSCRSICIRCCGGSTKAYLRF